MLNSCDDAGQNPVFVPKGRITFSHANLKQLNPAIDGLYTLWLKLDSSGTPVWYSLGQFNIGPFGEVLDPYGNPMIFTFGGDTSSLDYATKSTVTVGNDPEKSVLIGASLTVYPDSITGSYWIADELALGDPFGTAVYNGHYGKYTLQSPTDNNANCLKGLWLCDTLGNNVWPDVPDLPAGKGWVMEGWLNDESTNSFYSMGRFYSFNSADNDGAGPCKGPNGNGFNKPGQDWVQPNCTSPSISNLNNGNYGVFISLEPESEGFSGNGSPFPFKLFYHADIGTGCKAFNWVYSEAINGRIPKGKIKITN
ncbi:MAG TPA: hypothetical protein VGK25_03110 [Ignavibacteria bacterium]